MNNEFVKKKLTLSRGAHLVAEPIIKNKAITDSILSKGILQEAEEKGNKIIAVAKMKSYEIAHEIKHSMQTAVWQQMNELLSSWHKEREEMVCAMEEAAVALINSAIRHLAEEIPDEAKVRVHIRKLSEKFDRKMEAFLYCNPDNIESVRQTLKLDGIDHWELVANRSISADTFILKTVDGSYSVSWRNTLEQLLDIISKQKLKLAT